MKTQFVSVSQFLSYYNKPGTRKVYEIALTQFFKVVGVKPENYFTEDRDYATDIRNFIKWCKQQGLRDKSILSKLGGIRCYLSYNGYETSRFLSKEISREVSSEAVTRDKIPNRQELRNLLDHMDFGTKVIFSVQATSGMRLGEILKLLVEDVDFNSNPTRILIRGINTKNGKNRTAFISSEATTLLQEWLRIREDKLGKAVEHSVRRGKDKSLDDNRLFPYAVMTVHRKWTNALKDAGLFERDPITKRITIHPHSLRKYFRVCCGKIVSQDVAEALIGHQQGLNAIYGRYSEEQLAEEYRKCEDSLLLFTDTERIIKQIKPELQAQQKCISKVTMENQTLKEELSEIQQMLPDYTDIINKIQHIGGVLEKYSKLPYGEQLKAYRNDKLKAKSEELGGQT